MTTSFKTLLNGIVNVGMNGDIIALQNEVARIPIFLRRPVVESAVCILFNNKNMHQEGNFMGMLQCLCSTVGTLSVQKIDDKTFKLKKI